MTGIRSEPPRALSGSDTGRMESFRLDLKDKFAPLITDMISSKVSPDFTSTFLLQEEAAVTHTFLFMLFVCRSVYSILVTSAAGFGSLFCSRTKGPDPARESVSLRCELIVKESRMEQDQYPSSVGSRVQIASWVT